MKTRMGMVKSMLKIQIPSILLFHMDRMSPPAKINRIRIINGVIADRCNGYISLHRTCISRKERASMEPEKSMPKVYMSFLFSLQMEKIHSKNKSQGLSKNIMRTNPLISSFITKRM